MAGTGITGITDCKSGSTRGCIILPVPENGITDARPLKWTATASLTRKGLLNRLPVKHAFTTVYAAQRGDLVGEGGGGLGRFGLNRVQ